MTFEQYLSQRRILKNIQEKRPPAKPKLTDEQIHSVLQERFGCSRLQADVIMDMNTVPHNQDPEKILDDRLAEYGLL